MEKSLSKKAKKAIKEYQCTGCIDGQPFLCYQNVSSSNPGIECTRHIPATMISNIGIIYLGLPKGFNRVGLEQKNMTFRIFESFSDYIWRYDMYNIPVWKYLHKEFGNTIVRGMNPRLNEGWLHIFLEDCMAEIHCLEITDDDIKNMD